SAAATTIRLVPKSTPNFTPAPIVARVAKYASHHCVRSRLWGLRIVGPAAAHARQRREMVGQNSPAERLFVECRTVSLGQCARRHPMERMTRVRPSNYAGLVQSV